MVLRPTARYRDRRESLSTPNGAPETVRVELLGGFRVAVGSSSRTIEEDRWRLSKAAGLVKLLALAPGHRMHRERVIDLLWPDLAPKAAANNLRHVLHTARRTLEETDAVNPSRRYLRSQGALLALCPQDPLWVDVEAFEGAAANARRLEEPAAYRAAIELYTGELLPGDLYEEWPQGRREALRGTYLSLLVELASLYKEREEFGQAMEALREVLKEEPRHEGAHAGLMRLYALSGQRQAALRQYERLKEILHQELAAEPDTESRRLHEDIVAGRLPVARSASERRLSEEPREGPPRHNLPAPRSSFVGREREMVEVKRALAMTRLLTLTGVGGSGKTRLALEVARDLVGAYPDGVWLAELAALSEGELVPQEVAAALRIREQANRPLVSTLVEALRTKELVLVMDNCEHLIDSCARLVDMLLSSCPRLRILATSREPLNVAGEVGWRVPALSQPHPHPSPTATELEGYESVRLFVDRARSRSSGFVLTPRNAHAVAEICRQMDGIPLAIELAAVRVGALDVNQISVRLQDSLSLLTTGSRIAQPRHQTLRGALEWSHELLGEPERALFRRLSVFAGGWMLEAAEALGSGEGIREVEIVDLLGRLVEKSLVVAESGGEGALRYRMLEPVRQYARDMLEESAEAEAIQRRHAELFLALAEEAEPSMMRGGQQRAWLDRLEREHDNLRAALSWAFESEESLLGPEFAGVLRVLATFWYMHGHLNEGRRWLEAALANENTSPYARVRALTWSGFLLWAQGLYQQAQAFSEEGLELAEEVGDGLGAADALYNLGVAAMCCQLDLGAASAFLERSLALSRTLKEEPSVSRTLYFLGEVALWKRDYVAAAKLYEEGLAVAREAGDQLGIAFSLHLGGHIARHRGDYRLANALCTEGLKLCSSSGMSPHFVLYLHIKALIEGAQGRLVRAARLWGAAEAIFEEVGIDLHPCERRAYTPHINAARAQLGEAEWKAAWEEGRKMGPEQAGEYALSEEEKSLALATMPGPKKGALNGQREALTNREEEVAVLAARGLSNRQISAELTISERTVDRHISKILKKLGLRSRAQVAAWVAEN